jgi:hypothetical protein
MGIKKIAGIRFNHHKAIAPSKLKQARLDGEPYHPFIFLSATGGVNARDELAKRQWLFYVIGFHGMRIVGKTAGVLWGVFPMFWHCPDAGGIPGQNAILQWICFHGLAITANVEKCL